jgi:hypothetical protein
MRCSKVPVRFRIATDATGKAQPVAFALDRGDQNPAPLAETDGGSVDHRLVRRLPSSGFPSSGLLGARRAKMLVEEGKDLVPAIDRLLRPVIRAIVRKERVTGPVIAVELVVFA